MYKVEFTESAVKQLKKLDKQTVRVIKNWVIKNLVNTPDPRLHGKALKGNLKGIWRYRVGDYRLFASIEEEIITISILKSVIEGIFIKNRLYQISLQPIFYIFHHFLTVFFDKPVSLTH